jgi:hypothetical protein
VLASDDLHDCLPFKFLFAEPEDFLRGLNFVVDVELTDTGSGLAHGIHPPSPNVSLFVHGERMPACSSDDDGFPRPRPKNDLLWDSSVDLPPLDDLPSELTFLANAERVDVTVGGENEDMVVSGCDIHAFLHRAGFRSELEDGFGEELLIKTFGETESPLAILFRMISVSL